MKPLDISLLPFNNGRITMTISCLNVTVQSQSVQNSSEDHPAPPFSLDTGGVFLCR
jgi:hypothetical protein